MNTELVAEARSELARYFILSKDLKRPLPMFSQFIDEVWHEMLTDAVKYEQFCQQTVGTIVWHNPERGLVREVDWIKDYERRHGRLGRTWFMTEAGELNQEQFEAYRTKGFKAAWACEACTNCQTRVPKEQPKKESPKKESPKKESPKKESPKTDPPAEKG